MGPNHRIKQNVEEIVRIEGRDETRLSWSDRLADHMTAFSGSMMFVLVHAVWFGFWIALNLGWLGIGTFDEFPYGFLTMIVSLEAIFLSTFVLISQNREAMQADRRAKLDLQLNMVAEQEVTKLIEMVAQMQAHMGIETAHDPAVQQMQEPTYVEDVADAVESAEARAKASATGSRRDHGKSA